MGAAYPFKVTLNVRLIRASSAYVGRYICTASRVVDVPLIILITTSLLGLVESVLKGLALPSGTRVTAPPLFMLIGWIALYSFGTYWSLNVRRALAVRLYRSQALGIGLICASVLLLIFSEIVIAALSRPGGSGPFGEPVEIPFSYFVIFVIFYWVDASIRAARRSDPLLRDAFHWTKLRIIVWVVIILSITITSLFVLYLIIETGLPVDVAPNLPPIINLVSTIPFYLPVVLGSIVLLFGALRSRDPALRRHLGWFFSFLLLFLAIGLIFSAASIPVPSNFETLLYVAVIYGNSLTFNVGGYFLYRSARALAPLNKISMEESSTFPKTT